MRAPRGTEMWPGSKRDLHVEAAALRGKPVLFALTGPWSGQDREPGASSSGDLISFLILARALRGDHRWIGRVGARQSPSQPRR